MTQGLRLSVDLFYAPSPDTTPQVMSKKTIYTKVASRSGPLAVRVTVDGSVAADDVGMTVEAKTEAKQTTVEVAVIGQVGSRFHCLVQAIHPFDTETLHDAEHVLDASGEYAGVFLCQAKDLTP